MWEHLQIQYRMEKLSRHQVHHITMQIKQQMTYNDLLPIALVTKLYSQRVFKNDFILQASSHKTFGTFQAKNTHHTPSGFCWPHDNKREITSLLLI